MNDVKEDYEIVCEWSDQILVNPDGQVWPCCYWANVSYENQVLYEGKTSEWRDKFHFRKDKIYNDYLDQIDELNAFNKPLEEIIEGKWFSQDLPESWKSFDTACSLCVRFCSKKKTNK